MNSETRKGYGLAPNNESSYGEVFSDRKLVRAAAKCSLLNSLTVGEHLVLDTLFMEERTEAYDTIADKLGIRRIAMARLRKSGLAKINEVLRTGRDTQPELDITPKSDRTVDFAQLFHVDGVGIAEIAERFGCDEINVRRIILNPRFEDKKSDVNPIDPISVPAYRPMQEEWTIEIDALRLNGQTYGVLRRMGITNIRKLAEMSDGDIARIDNLGKVRTREIREKLKEFFDYSSK